MPIEPKDVADVLTTHSKRERGRESWRAVVWLFGIVTVVAGVLWLIARSA